MHKQWSKILEFYFHSFFNFLIPFLFFVSYPLKSFDRIKFDAFCYAQCFLGLLESAGYAIFTYMSILFVIL